MLRLYNYVAIASALAATVSAATLNVVNKCGEQVFLFTQTSFGSISNNLFVASGATQNMGISSNWDGAINVGKWQDRLHILPICIHNLPLQERAALPAVFAQLVALLGMEPRRSLEPNSTS